jgi:hypothetical protein
LLRSLRNQVDINLVNHWFCQRASQGKFIHSSPWRVHRVQWDHKNIPSSYWKFRRSKDLALFCVSDNSKRCWCIPWTHGEGQYTFWRCRPNSRVLHFAIKNSHNMGIYRSIHSEMPSCRSSVIELSADTYCLQKLRQRILWQESHKRRYVWQGNFATFGLRNYKYHLKIWMSVNRRPFRLWFEKTSFTASGWSYSDNKRSANEENKAGPSTDLEHQYMFQNINIETWLRINSNYTLSDSKKVWSSTSSGQNSTRISGFVAIYLYSWWIWFTIKIYWIKSKNNES